MAHVPEHRENHQDAVWERRCRGRPQHAVVQGGQDGKLLAGGDAEVFLPHLLRAESRQSRRICFVSSSTSMLFILARLSASFRAA